MAKQMPVVNGTRFRAIIVDLNVRGRSSISVAGGRANAAGGRGG
jgi:hypothetical protein